MEATLNALRASVERLRATATALDDAELVGASYCSEWTVADVLSHLGSGAVITQRRLQDARAGAETPEDFAPTVWDEWNAKSPRAQTDDALVADRALLEALEAVDDEERLDVHLLHGSHDARLPDVRRHAPQRARLSYLGRGGGRCRARPGCRPTPCRRSSTTSG